ncbi:unnamed protein product [Rotaria magnacalcarata]|uniref:Uncharacterized protein n=1 Tax=Rotaria magnacalcarata TaxID=392030 RepID=A0A814IN10_9BILA|nr:unnamed protein product [Rotaria magnacalcarata]CAF4449733.1 unnamed protein product [Rotaria magnacalcarata]
MCQELLSLQGYEHQYPAVNRKIQGNIHDFVVDGFTSDPASVFLSFPPTNGENRCYHLRRESPNSTENELIVLSKNKKKSGRYLCDFDKTTGNLIVAKTFIRSLKRHGRCIDAKSVHVRLCQYDISMKIIYRVRQHIFESVSVQRADLPAPQLMVDMGASSSAGENEREPPKVSRKPKRPQQFTRELRQSGMISQQLPPKRNGRP